MPEYLFTKWIFDIALSAIALVVLYPLMLAVVATIYIDDPHGSPISIQDRMGKIENFLGF